MIFLLRGDDLMGPQKTQEHLQVIDPGSQSWARQLYIYQTTIELTRHFYKCYHF